MSTASILHIKLGYRLGSLEVMLDDKLRVEVLSSYQ